MWICLSLAAWLVGAAPAGVLPSPTVLVSQSGQFLVSQPWKAPLPNDLATLATNPAYLRVDPALLLVSCERTRQRLAQELAGLPAGRDRIHLTIVPARSPTDRLTLLAERERGAWKYRLGIPEVVHQQRLLEALVHVILLELANQAAGPMSTDLPAWLVGGLAGRLRALAGEELLLRPPMDNAPLALHRTVIERRRYDPLAQARVILEEQGALSWQELCWPGASGHPDVESERFRATAQLLVHELLRLPKGSTRLARFITTRARFLNWQTAFLANYPEEFPRLLDVEKWWALQVALFTRADVAVNPTPPQVWAELREATRVPVEVRSAPDQLPQARTNLALQTVIRSWDWGRQRPALEACALRLETLALSLPWEARWLALAYARTLRTYLDQRPQADPGGPAARQLVRTPLPRLVYETLEQLNALDAELARRTTGLPLPATGTPENGTGRAGPPAGEPIRSQASTVPGSDPRTRR